MKKLLVSFFLLTFCQSCSMYKRTFDCPIPEGTPCTSVTKIESMIVERNEGPDLFVLTEESRCTCASPCFKNKRKIWFSSHESPNGVPIQGKSVFVEIEK